MSDGGFGQFSALAIALFAVSGGCRSGELLPCTASLPCPSGWACNLQLQRCQRIAGEGSGALGESCSDGLSCGSGHCVDGVCCQQASCDACNACDQSQQPGRCSALPVGAAPSGDCPGAALCGGRQCDGQGSCAYRALSSECGRTCSDGRARLRRCNAKHQCVEDASSQVDCSPATCDADGLQCRQGCQSHSGCVTSSACDRSEAHVTGRGQCVAPGRIIEVGPNAIDRELRVAVGLLSADRNVIKLFDQGSEYFGEVFIDSDASWPIKIIGVADPVLSGSSLLGPALVVSAGQLWLQGLVFGDALIDGLGGGVRCAAEQGRSPPRLTILESRFERNEGLAVQSEGCDVFLRRNEFTAGSGGLGSGGIDLRGGEFLLVNNVVRGDLLRLEPALTLPTVFYNNTIQSNRALLCQGEVAVVNSIVRGASPSMSAACMPSFSNVEGLDPLPQNNFDRDPAFVGADDWRLAARSALIDQGRDNPHSVIDFAGSARQKGAAVDIGAYER